MTNIKLAIICIYMGKLPKSFEFWLESCKNNREIDWILITDQDDIKMGTIKNFKIIKSSLKELKNRFEKKLRMSISLEKPYKLCDYKPSYGFFFEEELVGYDYWGYCDMDMIFGRILKVLPKNLIVKYDKILKNGHLTLYKNNNYINNIFKQRVQGTLSYKSVYSTDISCAFDESEKGIVKIFENCNIKTFYTKNFIDVSPSKYDFLEEDDKKSICYTFEEGKIYKNFYKNNKLNKEEKLYIHFQKREIDFNEVNIEKEKKYIFGEKIISFQNQEEIIKYILQQRDNRYKNIRFKMFYLREKQ